MNNSILFRYKDSQSRVQLIFRKLFVLYYIPYHIFVCWFFRIEEYIYYFTDVYPKFVVPVEIINVSKDKQEELRGTSR